MPLPRHRKRVAKELASNPAWRLEVGPAWLCPYCGEAVVRDPLPDEPPDEARAARALEHLERCGACREFEGRPLPLQDLNARAAALRAREAIRQALMSRPAWQLYDVARRWYCPFCAKATPAEVPEGGRISTAVLREIEKHLLGCDGWERGHGAEKPVAYLKSMVAYANRTRKMAEQIRRKIEADGGFRLRDAEGRWVCPYCRKVQERIDFSTPIQMVLNAPLEIAKHLSGSCEGFRAASAAGASQSAASLEIARLGTAPTPDLVELSGRPPAEVSGEFKAVGAAPGAAPAAEATGSRPQAAGTAGGPGGSQGSHPKPEARSSKPAEQAPPAAPRREERRDAIEASLTAMKTLATTPPAGARAGEAAVPPLPEVDGLELRHVFRGAHAHPYDFADVIVLDGRRIAIAVGGVAGEGAETGLVLPMVRNLLRMHAKKGRPPVDVLRLVNADIFADLDGRTFVSVVFGMLDVRHRTFKLARAGTNAPVLYNPKRKPDLQPIEVPGMVLGVDRGPVFESTLVERDVRLEPGDLLVAFTHGVVSAEDVDTQAIGLERLHDLVRRYGKHEADYLCAKIASFFEDWTRGAPLSEDACLLAVKVRP